MIDMIQTFFDGWSLADDAERTAKMAPALADGVTYADPRTPSEINGLEAIVEYTGMFAQSAPGAVAVVVDAQVQNGLTRATVAFRMPGGMEQMGQYFVATDDAGKITAMTGFVGIGTPA